jgi:hypothetical protein
MLISNSDSHDDVDADEAITLFQKWLSSLQKVCPDQSLEESKALSEEEEFFLSDFDESVRLARSTLPNSKLWADKRWNKSTALWAKQVVESELYTLDFPSGILKTYICLSTE